MFQFIETIKFLNGKLQNMSYHNDRFQKTRSAFFSIYDNMELEEHISIPASDSNILQKCRIIYGKTIQKVEFIPYQHRTIKTLKIVVADEILYSYKYASRESLDLLLRNRGNCDDIIIVKNNCVTDSCYANIVFRKDDKWVTPAFPLLKGTKRQSLLDKGIIREEDITLDDLKKFKKLRLINAMIGLNESEDIVLDNIQFK